MVEQTGIATLGSYNDTLIECRPSDEFINATAMCQATGKRWNDYASNKQTQEFLSSLEKHTGILVCELVQSSRANVGVGGGTWVHRRVAIHLAQWCSPDFAVWVSGQIEAIMTGRQVAHREHAEFAMTRMEDNVLSLQNRVCFVIEEMALLRREQQEQNKKLLSLYEQLGPAILRIDERTQGKREGFSSEVTKQFVHCVEKFYSGKCPCCMLRVVVENGKRVPHVAQVDHYYHRSMNRMEHGWLVCKTCNTKLKNRKPNGFWFQSGPAFHSFQQRLHQSDQLLLWSEDLGGK